MKKKIKRSVAEDGGDVLTNEWEGHKALLESLVKSESRVNQMRETVIKQAGNYATRPKEIQNGGSLVNPASIFKFPK